MAPVDVGSFESGSSGRSWRQDYALFDDVVAIFVSLYCLATLLLAIVLCGCCCDSSSMREEKAKQPAAVPLPTKEAKKPIENDPHSSSPSSSSSSAIGPSFIGSPIAQSERVSIAFALNWFRAAAPRNTGEGGSFASSPFAVQTAFALWYLGLNDSLKDTAGKTLFPGCANYPQVVTLLKTMVNATKWWRRKSIHLANRLCAPSSCRYSNSYRRQVSSLFGGNQFLPVDFMSNANALVDATNRWTASVTKERAKLLQSLDQHRQSGLLLVSAVFVEATKHLLYPFNRYRTQYGEPFYPTSRRKVNCDYMWLKKELGYCQDQHCQLIRLPYGGGAEMGLYIFLPRKRFGLANLESLLTTEYVLERLNACCSASKEVEISLPKIKISTQLNNEKMVEAVRSMGLATMEIFEKNKQSVSGAETAFSKMIRAPKQQQSSKSKKKQERNATALWMAQMVHGTAFELEDSFPKENEQPSVSASIVSMASVSAATESVVSDESLRARLEAIRPIFKANHPFLFLLAIDIPKIPIALGRFCGR